MDFCLEGTSADGSPRGVLQVDESFVIGDWAEIPSGGKQHRESAGGGVGARHPCFPRLDVWIFGMGSAHKMFELFVDVATATVFICGASPLGERWVARGGESTIPAGPSKTYFSVFDEGGVGYVPCGYLLHMWPLLELVVGGDKLPAPVPSLHFEPWQPLWASFLASGQLRAFNIGSHTMDCQLRLETRAGKPWGTVGSWRGITTPDYFIVPASATSGDFRENLTMLARRLVVVYELSGRGTVDSKKSGFQALTATTLCALLREEARRTQSFPMDDVLVLCVPAGFEKLRRAQNFRNSRVYLGSYEAEDLIANVRVRTSTPLSFEQSLEYVNNYFQAP